MDKNNIMKINIMRFSASLLMLGFIPNIIGASFIILFFMFLNFTSITKDLGANISTYDFTQDIILTALVFITVIVIVIVKVVNILMLLKKHIQNRLSDETIILLKQRILNIPTFVMHMTVLGWFLGAATIVVSMHLKGMSLVNKLFFFVIIFVIAGSLAFVITYYLFDSYFRKLIPVIFPDGDFTAVPGVKVLNINTRMLIAFWIGGLLPVIIILFFSFSYINNIKSGNDSESIFMQFIILMVFALVQSIFMGVLSSFYFSRNIGTPLKSIQIGMTEIQKGNYTVSLPVNQKDEIGIMNSGFNAMAVGLKERQILNDAFGKFISASVRDEVLQGKLALGGKRMQATILFSDIRNFTALSESLPAEDVVDILNSYFNEMVRPIMQNEGILDKFIGDAIMAVFGPPTGIPHHAEKALECALVMREKIKAFNALRKEFGQSEITAGIGINSGDIIAGTIGSSDRMEYTVIGDAVNTASRIEKLTKTQNAGIIVTEHTLRLLPEGHHFTTRELGRVMIRGKKESVLIYELTGKNGHGS